MSDEAREQQLAERVAAAYRESAPPDPDARRRLDRALARAPRPRRRLPMLRWLAEPWRLSPAIALAVPAGLLVLGVGIGRLLPGPHGSARATAPPAGGVVQPVEFVLVAPRAARVTLVGDFNGWDPDATPMARRGGETWTAQVMLPPGRHIYSYIVDGVEWLSDPLAPLAPANEFGVRNSVVIVSEGKPS